MRGGVHERIWGRCTPPMPSKGRAGMKKKKKGDRSEKCMKNEGVLGVGQEKIMSSISIIYT